MDAQVKVAGWLGDLSWWARWKQIYIGTGWKCGNPRRIHQVRMKTTLNHLPMANEPVFYRFKNWINPTCTPLSVSAETLLRTCRTWIWHTLYTKNRQRSGLTQKNWAEPTLDSAVRTQYSSASRVKGSPWSQIHDEIICSRPFSATQSGAQCWLAGMDNSNSQWQLNWSQERTLEKSSQTIRSFCEITEAPSIYTLVHVFVCRCCLVVPYCSIALSLQTWASPHPGYLGRPRRTACKSRPIPKRQKSSRMLRGAIGDASDGMLDQLGYILQWSTMIQASFAPEMACNDAMKYMTPHHIVLTCSCSWSCKHSN